MINENLLASDQFNKLIISSVNEGIAVYVNQLHIKVCNPFQEKYFGIMAEQVIGAHPWDFIPFMEEISMIDHMKMALEVKQALLRTFFCLDQMEIDTGLQQVLVPLSTLITRLSA